MLFMLIRVNFGERDRPRTDGSAAPEQSPRVVSTQVTSNANRSAVMFRRCPVRGYQISRAGCPQERSKANKRRSDAPDIPLLRRFKLQSEWVAISLRDALVSGLLLPFSWTVDKEQHNSSLIGLLGEPASSTRPPPTADPIMLLQSPRH